MDSVSTVARSKAAGAVRRGLLALGLAGAFCLAHGQVMAGDGKTVASPPFINITQQSTSVAACQGQSLQLSVTIATNPQAGVTYQWRRGTTNLSNDAKYSGVDQSTLTINNIQPGDVAANYSVYVKSTSAGQSAEITSQNIAVTVIPATQITTQPQSGGICPDGRLVVNAVAQGNNLTYQWYHNGNIMPGERTAAVIKDGPSARDTGNYYVIVNGECGADTSDIVNVGFSTPTRIINQPSPATIEVCEGANLNVAVTAEGTPIAGRTDLSYEWRRNNFIVTGAQSAAYSTTATRADEGYYKVFVRGACGEVLSDSVFVRVNPRPRILRVIGEPRSLSEGTFLTFEVRYEGEGLSFQWMRNGQPIPGEVSAKLERQVSLSDSGLYSVKITNACGDTTSGEVEIKTISGVENIFSNGYALETSVPNPVNELASFGFTVPTAQHVRIALTSVEGQEIAVLFNGMAEGRQSVSVNAAQLNLPAGTYFYTMSAGAFRGTQKLVIVR